MKAKSNINQTHILNRQVERIKTQLGYEVDCPKAIPSGIIDRFENWHKRQKSRECKINSHNKTLTP
jgi:hypothetical protein